MSALEIERVTYLVKGVLDHSSSHCPARAHRHPPPPPKKKMKIENREKKSNTKKIALHLDWSVVRVKNFFSWYFTVKYITPSRSIDWMSLSMSGSPNLDTLFSIEYRHGSSTNPQSVVTFLFFIISSLNLKLLSLFYVADRQTVMDAWLGRKWLSLPHSLISQLF